MIERSPMQEEFWHDPDLAPRFGTQLALPGQTPQEPLAVSVVRPLRRPGMPQISGQFGDSGKLLFGQRPEIPSGLLGPGPHGLQIDKPFVPALFQRTGQAFRSPLPTSSSGGIGRGGSSSSRQPSPSSLSKGSSLPIPSSFRSP
jgi:hypothetical protein